MKHVRLQSFLVAVLLAAVSCGQSKSPPNSSVPAAAGQRGSTMTLEQLQGVQAKQKKQAEEPQTVILQPAAEPIPALRYRFWIPPHDRKPGSAFIHFSRALFACRMPGKQSEKWIEWSDKRVEPTEKEFRRTVESLQFVFDELHELALSEDTSWDLRIRDLRGPSIYAFRLPEVQESRVLARALRLKISYHLRHQEFDAAFAAITDGNHLAAFVGQGESLIQKLVATAIASFMRDGIEEAIQTPGCPNVYWAVAAMPNPLVPMHEAVDWEINNVRRVLPILDEALNETWTEDEALREWTKAFTDFKSLTGEAVVDSNFQIALSVASLTVVDAARERLIQAGLPKDRVAAMPAIQAALADGALQLRRHGDNVGKGQLLPVTLSKTMLEQETVRFREWSEQNRYTSVAAAIARELFPAVQRARAAETRTVMLQNRLMTVEAIRMYAQQNDGQFPESLSKLLPVPAMSDPYSGKSFGLVREDHDGESTVVLTSGIPARDARYGTLRLKLAAPKTRE